MYDIIESIIGHVWQTNYTGDQQYIYYCCCTLIVILTVVFLDMVYRVFSHFWRA